MHDPDFFPGWVRLAHALNILFISLLIRSGVQILGSFPRLYLHDNCRPGTEWVKFTSKRVPRDRLWTSLDEEQDVPLWLGLPGRKNLGLARAWHFCSVAAWILIGLAYLVLLAVSGSWRYLIPTSWAIFPATGHAAATYLSLHLAAPLPGQPFNGLQKLAYFAVVYLLAPLQIATGAAMSPAFTARFPWYLKLFGGRQTARSLHFLSLAAFVLFIIVHTAMVIAHGFGNEVALVIFGRTERTALATAIALVAIGAVVALHIAATVVSLRDPRGTQRALGRFVEALMLVIFTREGSREHYPRRSISPYFWVNGRPPAEETYRALAQRGFADWRLEVGGLVEHPLRLSLDDLRAMPAGTQITLHNCIQGWSDTAEWTGVPLADLIARCRPLPAAHYVVFYALDDKSTSEPDPQGGGYFYETLSLELARHPQTLLAYAMNGAPLPIVHGAPLRLRVETQLGFKMVKYLRAIEFVADYRHIGQGMGGWREDHMYYDTGAGI
ncbi:MAG TPA: molybdopterin-dependent oxidoreductase [Thermomicrobiales bacterium]|nr:molybdopterin-dependent oxidoreductase [Thermomicrobiales bacterium]